MPKWKVNPITAPFAADAPAWEIEAARAAILEWAGGDTIDPDKARQGFLLTDEAAADLPDGYKLPYCVIIDGDLFAVQSALTTAIGTLSLMVAGGEKVAGLPEGAQTGENSADGITGPDGAEEGAEDAQGGQKRIPAQVRNTDTGGPAAAPAEFKTMPGFAKVEGDRTVTGFPTIYGNVDDGGDMIKPGAYAKTIAERAGRFRWLWQHDWQSPPTATIESVESVGREGLPLEVLQRYPEAEGGLRVRRRYLQTQRGDEILQGIASGAITEMSIGYDTISQERPEDMIIGGKRVERILREMRLWEFSDVLWGMNPATANAKSFWDKVATNYPDDALFTLLTQAGRLDALFAKYRAGIEQELEAAAGGPGNSFDEAAQRQRRLRLAAARLQVIG